MLVHHRKWRTGEYLATYTLFVTLIAEFLVEIASELDPLDCDCSASEQQIAVDGVEETVPIESGWMITAKIESGWMVHPLSSS